MILLPPFLKLPKGAAPPVVVVVFLWCYILALFILLGFVVVGIWSEISAHGGPVQP